MKSQAFNSLLGLDREELTGLVVESGQPAYRGQQLFEAVYRQRIERLDQVSTLPLEYRLRLTDEGWGIGLPSIDRKFVSSDESVRYLLRLGDGETVETVWMPEGDGGESGDGSEAGEEGEEQFPTQAKRGLECGTLGSQSIAKGALECGTPGGRRRATICVSSQVGCAVNCKFCLQRCSE